MERLEEEKDYFGVSSTVTFEKLSGTLFLCYMFYWHLFSFFMVLLNEMGEKYFFEYNFKYVVTSFIVKKLYMNEYLEKILLYKQQFILKNVKMKNQQKLEKCFKI